MNSTWDVIDDVSQVHKNTNADKKLEKGIMSFKVHIPRL